MSDKRRRFEAMVIPHLDAAYNLARWLARPPVEAEDVVQDAMLRAFRAFDGFRGQDARPWLLAILRNCFMTAAARSVHRYQTILPGDGNLGSDDPALVAADPSPETALLGAEQDRLVNQAIAALPQQFREVLILREMEDLSYREIAEITETPIGTVMSRLARARTLLRDSWMSDREGVGHHELH